MVSIWLTRVKDRVRNGNINKIGLAKRSRFYSNADDLWLPTGDIAECGWCAGRPSHAGQSRIAKKGIRRLSGYIGCTPLRGRADRRERRQQLRPFGESPTVWSRARADPRW